MSSPLLQRLCQLQACVESQIQFLFSGLQFCFRTLRVQVAPRVTSCPLQSVLVIVPLTGQAFRQDRGYEESDTGSKCRQQAYPAPFLQTA